MYHVNSGFELIGKIVAGSGLWSGGGFPHILVDVPVGYALIECPSMPRPYLIITGNSCPLYIRDLLWHEPDGLIAPGGAVGLDQIERGLREVQAGRHVYMGPSLQGANEVSPREHRIVRMVALGSDNQAIAEEMGVSTKTVRNAISGITAKLGLNNRVKLCHYYLGLCPGERDDYPD